MNNVQNKKSIDFTILKQALYMVQVLTLAIAIPLLYVVELSHNNKMPEASVPHGQTLHLQKKGSQIPLTI